LNARPYRLEYADALRGFFIGSGAEAAGLEIGLRIIALIVSYSSKLIVTSAISSSPKWNLNLNPCRYKSGSIRVRWIEENVDRIERFFQCDRNKFTISSL
jgi:hypothetical protein